MASRTQDKSRRRKLTRSQEDYLEAVYLLIEENRVARVRDIAARLGVVAPSVTSALKTLSNKGLIHYEAYQYVTLTEPGLAAAEKIHSRHETLRTFFQEVLGLEEDSADDNACRVEHAIDEKLLERLGEFNEFARRAGLTGEEWMDLDEDRLVFRNNLENEADEPAEQAGRSAQEDTQ
ncbi:MAG: metal-dependent transcriptional regulator [Phycisphaerae bacterium]